MMGGGVFDCGTVSEWLKGAEVSFAAGKVEDG